MPLVLCCWNMHYMEWNAGDSCLVKPWNCVLQMKNEFNWWHCVFSEISVWPDFDMHLSEVQIQYNNIQYYCLLAWVLQVFGQGIDGWRVCVCVFCFCFFVVIFIWWFVSVVLCASEQAVQPFPAFLKHFGKQSSRRITHLELWEPNHWLRLVCASLGGVQCMRAAINQTFAWVDRKHCGHRVRKVTATTPLHVTQVFTEVAVLSVRDRKGVLSAWRCECCTILLSWCLHRPAVHNQASPAHW